MMISTSVSIYTVKKVNATVSSSLLDANAWKTREQILANWSTLETTYPNLVSHEVFGKTFEGRDMLVYFIGDKNKAIFMIDGATHGQEVSGSELCYYYAKWILERNDPVLSQTVLTNSCIMIVPIVNVDGYKTHRKNMDLIGWNGSGSFANYGVDLNRNFDWHWDYGNATTGGGVSSDPVNANYKGPSANSEPETKAYISLWNRYTPKHYLNNHAFGNQIIWKADTKYVTDSEQKTEDDQVFQSVYNEYVQLTSEWGNTAIHLSTDGGTGNFGMSPYYYHRTYSWSNEIVLSQTSIAYSTLLPQLMNQWFPFYITLNLASCGARILDITTIVITIMIGIMIPIVMIIAYSKRGYIRKIKSLKLRW